MARILLIDRDPVFSALLEDRLHVAGHRVEQPTGPFESFDQIGVEGFDLILLGESQAPLSPAESVRTLRRRITNRGTALLLIPPEDQNDDRVEALKAGADDYLARPFDLEEVVLRVDRLTGAGPSSSAILEGELENHPLWEVLQYIETSRKSGRLTIRSSRSRGSLLLRDGAAHGADIGDLQGREALIALLELDEGRFRLSASEGPSEEGVDDGESVWRLNQVMMEAAWLSDELSKRRGHLPPTGAPLEVVAGPDPELPEGAPPLPMQEILKAIDIGQRVRLYDLMQNLPHAPQRLRLAVAVLGELGRVRPQGETPLSPPTTREIDQSLLIDGAVSSLISAAGRKGFDTRAVPFLVLTGKSGMEEIKQILARSPQRHEADPIAKLLDALERKGSGSTTFRLGDESLSLHVHGLDQGARKLVDTVVPICAGVMLWLDAGSAEDLLKPLVQRVETGRLPAWGVVLAADAGARPTASKVTQGSDRWLATLQAPRSLLGLLRLFLPARPS